MFGGKGVVTAAALIVASTGALAAQRGAMDPKMQDHMEQMHADMMGMEAYGPAKLLEQRAALSLTADQVTQLQALADTVKRTADPAKAEHDTHHDAVVKMFQQASVDPAQVSQHAQAAMQAMTKACVAEMTAAAKARNVLTAAQRTQVDAKVAAMRDSMKTMMPMRGHDGH